MAESAPLSGVAAHPLSPAVSVGTHPGPRAPVAGLELELHAAKVHAIDAIHASRVAATYPRMRKGYVTSPSAGRPAEPPSRWSSTRLLVVRAATQGSRPPTWVPPPRRTP